MGYVATSDQFWAGYEFNGVYSLRFNDTMSAIRSDMTFGLGKWMNRYPQRELGMTMFQRKLTQKDAHGGTLFSFYPPADPSSTMGHFVTFLEPLDAEPRLVVANTLGVIQGLNCRTLEKGEAPQFIDMSENAWKCRNNCANSTQPNMCHSQASVGRRDPKSEHFSQIVTCAQPSQGVEGILSPLILVRAKVIAVEIAIKVNPPYESVSAAIFPPPQNAFSFKANDSISGSQYYVDVLSCQASLIPGDGIVDSVVKRFMHFLPYGLGLAQETPEIMADLAVSLPEMLNITITPPLTLLHNYFQSSNYGDNQVTTLNNSLPVWFGVHKPAGEEAKTTKVFNYVPTAQLPFTAKDEFKIDNMIRVNGQVLQNAFIALANSSFISALPNFVVSARKPGFSYQTDVKLVRGIPVAIAPLILLMPVLLVAYWSIRLWAVPTWTEFLDSFAMFRLGCAWEREMEGCGASSLTECWQAREISGIVGDSEPEKLKEVMESSGREYVGVIKLGGAQLLEPGVKYA
ncbi:hypothetical protein Q9L58_007473 [Maublancomyces gigas]|uniref:Uncharacterized protein n=1 Tax=Discina gigas TaxID=1032678 RepID=A0ABR3GCU3_9PEZI